jgi:hypothetical protein
VTTSILRARLVPLTLLGSAFLGAWLVGARPGAAAEGLSFPAPAGTRWAIAAGYNTATHIDGDPYAIDVVRDDGETTGALVFAPTDGTLSISTNCLTVRDAARVGILLCHVFPQSGLRAGQRVVRGQLLGSVAPPGAAGNNGLAHIHIAAHFATDGRGFGNTIPLAGAYAIEGVQLPATTEPNAYTGVLFTSTNIQQFPPAVTATATAASKVTGTPTPKATAPATQTAAPAPGTQASVSGLRPSGSSLVVVVTPSTSNDLVSAARASGAPAGCTFSSLVQGRWVTYIDGAPTTVNEGWRVTYPTTVPAMTPLFIACR